MSMSSTLLPGNLGACITKQHSLCAWAYWSSENSSPRSLRAWRYQQGRRLWTQVRTSCELRFIDADIHGNVLQGSRPRCLCRFFCCTVFITLFLVAAIVLALALVCLLNCAPWFLSYIHSSGYDLQISSLEVVITAQ